MNNQLSIEQEIQARIGWAASTFNRLCDRAWLNKHLTLLTKCRIYDCCVLSTLLYGAETWTTHVCHEKRLNAYHLRCLRRIMGINWWDKVTNEEVLKRAGSRSLFQSLKTRRMRWLGHLRRMPDGRLPKDILFSELRHGRRGRARPLLRFKDVAKRDLNDLAIDVTEWEHLAQDRLKWRSAIKTSGERLESLWLRKLALQRQRRSTND